MEPFQATDSPLVENREVVATPVHETPSVDTAITLPDTLPPVATHSEPFHATSNAPFGNIEVVAVPVHVTPSDDVAITLPDVFLPTAVQIEPFHAIPSPIDAKTVDPMPIQFIPS
jgi:hypothetical protein